VPRPCTVENRLCVEKYPEVPRPCVVDTRLGFTVTKELRYPELPKPWTVEFKEAVEM